MSVNHTESKSGSNVVHHLLEQLRRHPKRVVFAEGEDVRVIEAAARLVKEEAVAPILLGNKEVIRAIAKENDISLKFIHLIDPPTATDFPLFCQRVVNMARYRSMQIADPAEWVARPHYFGALMVQYGQADAIVAGNQAAAAGYFRALLNTIKPLPHVPKIFGLSVMIGKHLQNLGGDGMILLADTGLIPDPTVDNLASIAVESGKLASHFLGRRPRVAMLSHSTKGSAVNPSVQKVVAATSLAQYAVTSQYLDIEIEGELQADVAMDPDAAEIKLPSANRRQSADVLVFPNLDAANISLKLLEHLADAQVYGQLIMGLARPAAQVATTASMESIFGTAVAVAVEAIKYHELYPDGDV